jgi:hypothetical protein
MFKGKNDRLWTTRQTKLDYKQNKYQVASNKKRWGLDSSYIQIVGVNFFKVWTLEVLSRYDAKWLIADSCCYSCVLSSLAL